MSDFSPSSSVKPLSSNPAPSEPDPEASVFDRRTVGSQSATAWISTATADDAWDAFLQSTPLGHFQQSSIWGKIKATEGWQTIRVTIRQNDAIIGGFQIGVRSRKLLREGFLNKGPVSGNPDPALAAWMLDLIERVAKLYHIHVLVSQLPDADHLTGDLQDARGYAPNGLANLITATFCVPLGTNLPSAESRMRRTIRLETRQAIRRGVVVREGGAKDIPDFFQMMCVSCRRQGVTPNPATEAAVLTLWTTFHAKGLARLTIAECDGKPTAGLLTLRFGTRVTQWKKGWNEEHRDRHPNTLLAFECIQWAEQHGADLVDFVGGDRAFTRAILSGELPDKALLGSRYFFLMGFGSEPRLLPLARVWFPHRTGRILYRSIVPILRKLGRIET